MIDYKYPRLGYFDVYDTSIVIDAYLFVTTKIRRSIMLRVVPNVERYIASTRIFGASLKIIHEFKTWRK
jgi:hypothetical protein